MAIYSDPPQLTSFRDDKPILLVCWWATIFCVLIILLRVGGRFVRSERLFTEDKFAALAVVPLCLRMGCVHAILTYGTNNAQLEGVKLSELQIHDKSVASGLVLLSRPLYAATLWILKNTILEYFARLNVSWERSYVKSLRITRWILIVTIGAVIISDLAECQPFAHYWQVLPDPGGRCRQGYVQLLTMAICNILTDMLLVCFPVPIVLQSGMTVKRKTQLISLFSLSLAVIATTLYRVPHIIESHGSQSSRSLYASIELLVATAAANALVLGSFVRDRGVKKRRFKYNSVADGSLERSSGSHSRRSTVTKAAWGSLEDLAGDTGFGVQSEVRDQRSLTDRHAYQPATPAPVAIIDSDMRSWDFPSEKPAVANGRDDQLARANTLSGNSLAVSPRRVSFFDVGGLLDDHDTGWQDSLSSGADPSSQLTVPSPSMSAASVRRGSAAFLHDIGAFGNSSMSPPARMKGLSRLGNSTE